MVLKQRNNEKLQPTAAKSWLAAQLADQWHCRFVQIVVLAETTKRQQRAKDPFIPTELGGKSGTLYFGACRYDILMGYIQNKTWILRFFHPGDMVLWQIVWAPPWAQHSQSCNRISFTLNAIEWMAPTSNPWVRPEILCPQGVP